MGLVIGIWPNPQASPRWQAIRELLEPAAKLGGVPVLEDGELVWVASDGPDIMAAITTRTTIEGAAEIMLAGGAHHRRWASKAVRLIEDWAKAEGMNTIWISGRAGWAKTLIPLGWRIVGRDGRGAEFEKGL